MKISYRPLTQTEKDSLETEISRFEKKNRFHYRFTIISAVLLVVAVIAILSMLGTRENMGLISIAVVLILFYIFSVIWGYRQNKKMFGSTIYTYKEALSQNKVKVHHCYAEKYAAFENKSLDEPAYFFQINSSEALFLRGNEFYETDKFPNSDFEIASILGKNDNVVLMNLSTKGIKLQPTKVLPDKWKIDWQNQKNYPKSFEIFKGKISDIAPDFFN